MILPDANDRIIVIGLCPETLIKFSVKSSRSLIYMNLMEI